MDETIRMLSSENSMIVILSDYVCDKEIKKCRTVIDGTLIYRDDDHLNNAGSLLIAKWLEESYQQFVK